MVFSRRMLLAVYAISSAGFASACQQFDVKTRADADQLPAGMHHVVKAMEFMTPPSLLASALANAQVASQSDLFAGDAVAEALLNQEFDGILKEIDLSLPSSVSTSVPAPQKSLREQLESGKVDDDRINQDTQHVLIYKDADGARVSKDFRHHYTAEKKARMQQELAVLQAKHSKRLKHIGIALVALGVVWCNPKQSEKAALDCVQLIGALLYKGSYLFFGKDGLKFLAIIRGITLTLINETPLLPTAIQAALVGAFYYASAAVWEVFEIRSKGAELVDYESKKGVWELKHQSRILDEEQNHNAQRDAQKPAAPAASHASATDEETLRAMVQLSELMQSAQVGGPESASYKGLQMLSKFIHDISQDGIEKSEKHEAASQENGQATSAPMPDLTNESMPQLSLTPLFVMGENVASKKRRAEEVLTAEQRDARFQNFRGAFRNVVDEDEIPSPVAGPAAVPAGHTGHSPYDATKHAHDFHGLEVMAPALLPDAGSLSATRHPSLPEVQPVIPFAPSEPVASESTQSTNSVDIAELMSLAQGHEKMTSVVVGLSESNAALTVDANLDEA